MNVQKWTGIIGSGQGHTQHSVKTYTYIHSIRITVILWCTCIRGFHVGTRSMSSMGISFHEMFVK